MATILRMEQVYTDRIIHGPRVETAKTSNDVVHQGLVPGYSGTKLLDYKRYGSQGTSSNTAAQCAYIHWDASANERRIYGPVRQTGTALPKRYQLVWIAGLHGLVTINASLLHTTDRDFEVLGTNADATEVTYDAEGGLKLTTEGGDEDQTILLPNLTTSVTAWANVTWGSDKQTEWECDISTGSNITSTTIWAGLKLTNTSVTATDADQTFFRYNDATNSGKWQAIDSNTDVDNAQDTGVTVAVSTRYHLKIAIDSSRVPRYWANGAFVATGNALKNATDYIPYIGVQQTVVTDTKFITVHGQAISREIG